MPRKKRSRPPAALVARAPVPESPPAAVSSDRRLVVVAWCVFSGLVAFGYANVLRLGFTTDDFLILDAVSLRPVTSAIAWSHLIAGWWRPWSRDLHFWILDRLFGADSAVFHAANVVLWLAVLAVLLVLVRRLADARTSVVVVAGAFAATAWGIFLTWASCSQDLWMLLFGELFLLAQLADRPWLASLALALALLSKETAILMVPTAAWMQLTLRGRGSLRARGWAPPVGVLVAWALLHPSLGGRWLFHSGSHFLRRPEDLPSAGPLHVLLGPWNLEWRPDPRGGWPGALAAALVWAGALGGLTWFALRAGPAGGASPGQRRRYAALDLGWCALAWAPRAMPGLQWHSYYGWFGFYGVWLALAAALTGRRWALVGAIAIVSALRPLAADTRVIEWGTESYQRLTSQRTERIRAQLLALHPGLPRHSRIFVAGIPAGTSILTGVRYSAAVHVWYRDTTIAMAGMTNYWTRTAADSVGPDLFCVLDRELHLFPVATGVMPVPDSLRLSPVWEATEEQVGGIFGDAGDWDGVRRIFAGLAVTYPDTARIAYDLGVALDKLGDTRVATVWLDRADSLVGEPPSRGRGFEAHVGR